jgi:hypothetical protein
VNTNRWMMLCLVAALGLTCVTELRAQERERRSSRESSSSRDRERSRETQQAAPTTMAPAPQGYGDRYGVLESRNVFLRDRSRPASRPSNSSSGPTTRRSVEETLVLRGIAVEDGGIRAYVEDTSAGNTLRLSPGDKLAHGLVAAIEIDAIAYEHDGKETWIEIGRDLTGKAAAAPTIESSSSASASATTLPANVDLNDPNLTAEQRMRLRRQLLEQRGRTQ